MRLVFLLLCTLVGHFSVAQSNYQFGLLPSININKEFDNDIKLNVRIESRQELKSGLLNEPSPLDYEYVLTDFSLISAKKITANATVGLGYLMRLRDNAVFHRSIMQFIVTKNYGRFKLAHRFSADQTFSATDDTEFRLRYRIASEIPLNGQSVDPMEFYLKVNNEYLNAWQSGAYDLEIRVVPFLGFEFSDTKKVELGVDYRVNSFVSGYSSNRFWIGVNWYQKIK